MELKKTNLHNHFKIKIPIFDSLLEVVQSSDYVESAKKLKLEISNLDSVSALTIDLTNGIKRRYLIFLPVDFTVGLIAHECLHVTNILFGHIGYMPKTDNDELQAYLLQWICDELTIKLKIIQ